MVRLLVSLSMIGLALPALAADTVKLAITGPFTGGSAPMGASMRDGAKLAIGEINAAGGIPVGAVKMKIEVIERDDEAKNERGALIAQELASLSDLSGVIGSVNTGVVMAGDRHLQEKGITKIITPAAGSASMTQWVGKAKDLSIFRFAAHDGIQSAMVVEEAINRKFTKVAIFHDATNYGVSGRDDLQREIKKQGDKLQVVATEKFNIGDKDMTAQLLRAKSGGAEAILIWAIGPELAAVANGRAKMGMTAPLIGGWTLSMSNFIDNAGKNGNGALMPQTFIEDPITPKAKAFIEAYHKAYNVNRIPSAVSAAQGYDAVYLFAAAVKQAGSTDTHKIKDALEDLKDPVRGVIAVWKHPYTRWDPNNVETHEAFRREHCVMGMVQDGKVIFAHEEDRQRLAALAKAP
ncbi:MAG TPA: ABC transporter substrate-binding protein [Myxococcales bacterium]|jgi:branched-chain amino acid transport system substrate-binding protein